MMLLGVLGLYFDDYVDDMCLWILNGYYDFFFMMVSGIILKYYFGYHVAFGLLVAFMISFMMAWI